MTWWERFFVWLARVLTIPPPGPTPGPAPDPPPAPRPDPDDPIPPDPDDEDPPPTCVVKDRDGLTPSQTFIWKPVADVGSIAAVVLPAAFSACPPLHPRVTVYYGAGNRRHETGRWNRSFANGMRMAFRFTHPGSYFGKRLRVVVRRADGSTFAWNVPNGAVRFEDRYE